MSDERETPTDQPSGYAALEAAARLFVERVEAGEIRSVRSYRMFSDALRLIDEQTPTDQPVMGELLPCPFCGGSPKIGKDDYVERAHPEKYPEGGRSWPVCTNCETFWKKNTRAEAIAAWNTRATPPAPLMGEVERALPLALLFYDSENQDRRVNTLADAIERTGRVSVVNSELAANDLRALLALATETAALKERIERALAHRYGDWVAILKGQS